MRIAVLGVGLIGGSVGLAAKEWLDDSHVIGFGRNPERLDRARELGAIDRASTDIAEALDGAEACFACGPVGALPELVERALAAAPADCVVTDVGSTKRRIVESITDQRFVGGHPIAGAETAGVENARAGLFEGARWYLTPGGQAGGLDYDRLQRAVAEMGARPQAIDAELHDRLMATVSHLPHVIANVLVQAAAAALAEESERLPEVGPSFRDTTRVAGANPAIWEDIYAANSEAVADAIDAVTARLAEASQAIRGADGDTVARWHRASGEDRRRLLEAGTAGGSLHALQVAVENKPGVVAEIALALGRERVNIEDMALYPATDMSTGAITLWVAGAEEAERAAEVVRGLGHRVSIAGSES